MLIVHHTHNKVILVDVQSIDPFIVGHVEQIHIHVIILTCPLDQVWILLEDVQAVPALPQSGSDPFPVFPITEDVDSLGSHHALLKSFLNASMLTWYPTTSITSPASRTSSLAGLKINVSDWVR